MRSCAICYGRKGWRTRRTAASGSRRSTACWTRAKPGNNGRLDREAALTIGDRQISLTPIALRSAAFAAAWRVSYRESATLDLDQRSGRAGGHDLAAIALARIGRETCQRTPSPHSSASINSFPGPEGEQT